MVQEEMSLDAHNELADVLDVGFFNLFESKEEACGTMASPVYFAETSFTHNRPYLKIFYAGI
jgi:hypothetical protein